MTHRISAPAKSFFIMNVKKNEEKFCIAEKNV